MNIRTSKDTKTAARQALANNWTNAVVVAVIISAITGAAASVYYFVNFIVSVVASAASFIGLNSFGSFFYRGADFFDATLKNPALENVLSGFGVSTAIALIIIMIMVFAVSYLFLFAVTSNLSVGAARYYLNLVSSNNAKISDVFFSFKACPFKSILVTLLVELKTFLWGMLMLVPFCIFFLFLAYFDLGAYPAYVETILCFCLIELVGITFLLIFYVTYRYSLVYVVLAQNPTLGVRETVKTAVQTIKGYKMRRFILDLSFIGWYILCAVVSLLTLGIGGIVGTLFLTPYVCAAQAVQFCDMTGAPTVRHDFVNVPYQAYQGFQSDAYDNQDSSQTDSENNE